MGMRKIGSRIPCWLHSKQPARYRDAPRGAQHWIKETTSEEIHGKHKRDTSRGTSGAMVIAPI